MPPFCLPPGLSCLLVFLVSPVFLFRRGQKDVGHRRNLLGVRCILWPTNGLQCSGQFSALANLAATGLQRAVRSCRGRVFGELAVFPAATGLYSGQESCRGKTIEDQRKYHGWRFNPEAPSQMPAASLNSQQQSSGKWLSLSYSHHLFNPCPCPAIPIVRKSENRPLPDRFILLQRRKSRL